MNKGSPSGQRKSNHAYCRVVMKVLCVDTLLKLNSFYFERKKSNPAALHRVYKVYKGLVAKTLKTTWPTEASATAVR